MINVECGIVGTGGTDEMGAVRRLKSEGRGSKLRTLQPSALRPLTPRAILASLARIRLRPSAAGVRLRVVLLRHVVPERGFLADCRGGDGRYQGCREPSPR